MRLQCYPNTNKNITQTKTNGKTLNAMTNAQFFLRTTFKQKQEEN